MTGQITTFKHPYGLPLQGHPASCERVAGEGRKKGRTRCAPTKTSRISNKLDDSITQFTYGSKASRVFQHEIGLRDYGRIGIRDRDRQAHNRHTAEVVQVVADV